MPRRILIAGSGGQVGVALQRVMLNDIELLALDRKGLNIADAKAVKDTVTLFKPDWIINAAAYTAVDKAEKESDLAFAVNRDGAKNLALAADVVGARMVQISTDYVFDGVKASPYDPDDPVNPVNVYGESKLAGEVVTRKILGNNLLILRTAWVYSSYSQNFLTTMLRLMRERRELRVIEDQIGTPTSALTLAKAILSAIDNEVTGTHHWTDAGVASWYDFANAINILGVSSGVLENTCSITPISANDYPALARRPACTLLEKQKFRACIGDDGGYWQSILKQVIDSIDGGGFNEQK